MNQLSDFFYDFLDIIRYDLLRQPLPKPKDFSDDKLHLKFHLNKEKKGGMWLEADDYPGLIASGDTYEELREAVLDSILTYFDVPRAYAKRYKDTLRLNLPNGKVVKPKKSFWPEITIQVATT